MPAANFTQHSFLGGEVSARAEGRGDLPFYRQSLKLSLNGLPVEEGAWVRRPAFVDLGCTHKGRPAIIRTHHAGGKFGPAVSTTGRSYNYLLEYSVEAAGASVANLRVWVPTTNGYPELLCEAAVGTITSFSSASPTLMTMSTAQTWVTGDTIIITATTATGINAANLDGRQFIVTKVSTTTFTLTDAATAANIDGTTISFATTTATAKKISVFPTTYTATLGYLPTMRTVQSGTNVLFLSFLQPTWLATISNAATPVVTFADANFKEADGPYLDALPGTSQTDNKTATATTSDGLTYHITIGGDGPAFSFTDYDIGRCFRIWTQPAAWAAGTYTTNDTVTYNGAFWTCLAAGTTAAPGQPQAVAGIQTFPWLLTPNLGKWTSTYITARTNTSEIDVRIAFTEETSPLVRLTIDAWRMGVFGDPNGGERCYPASAGFFEGRLFLGGMSNRIDASMSGTFEAFIADQRALFSPTDINGNVFDDAAISGDIRSGDQASALWWEQDKQGMVFGTGNGEWLVSAGGAGNVTPTTVEVRQLSRYKAAYVDPVRVGSTVIFPQASGAKVYEFLVDAFSSHYRALPLNRYAQHLAEENSGIQELAYQEDPTPIVWATTGSITWNTGVRVPGSVLLGCTYRRVSDFATVGPEFNGWHQHTHGAGRYFYSIAMATILNGQEALAAVTSTTTTSGFRVEVMSRLWGPA